MVRVLSEAGAGGAVTKSVLCKHFQVMEGMLGELGGGGI